MSEFLRTYKPYDLEDVTKHLLIVGDLTGNCASCRMLGIDPYTARQCPECATPFKYLASRRLEGNPGERFGYARRMQEKRPDLVLIDFGDYTKSVGQKKARDFFG